MTTRSRDAPDAAAFVDQLRQHRRTVATREHQMMLDVAIEHATAEVVDHDIDRLMATMVAEPRHEFYGLRGVTNLVGHDAVRSYYGRTFSIAGPDRGAMEIDRVIVGDTAIVMLGTVVYTGGGLAVRAPDIARQLDLSRPCVIRKALCLVMPFEGTKIEAEIHFFDGDFDVADLVYLDV